MTHKPEPRESKFTQHIGRTPQTHEIFYLESALANMRVRRGKESTRESYEHIEELIGENIRQQRNESAMSQEQLALAMGMVGFQMHQTTIAKIENGRRPLRVAELYAIADILDVPLLALLANQRLGVGVDETPLPIDDIADDISELMHERADTMSKLTETVESLAQSYGEQTARIQFRISSILDAAARAHRGDTEPEITAERADELAEEWLRKTKNRTLFYVESADASLKERDEAIRRTEEFAIRNQDALNQIYETERANGSTGYEPREDRHGSPA